MRGQPTHPLNGDRHVPPYAPPRPETATCPPSSSPGPRAGGVLRRFRHVGRRAGPRAAPPGPHVRLFVLTWAPGRCRVLPRAASHRRQLQVEVCSFELRRPRFSGGVGSSARTRRPSTRARRRAESAAPTAGASRSVAGRRFLPHLNGRNVAGSGTGQGATRAPVTVRVSWRLFTRSGGSRPSSDHMAPKAVQAWSCERWPERLRLAWDQWLRRQAMRASTAPLVEASARCPRTTRNMCRARRAREDSWLWDMDVS